MKRSDALAPLSRDHHVALEAALRLRRADDTTVAEAQARFLDFWATHGARHFELEEAVLLPALPATDPDWSEATARVRAEHAAIRERASELRSTPAPARVEAARQLGELLNGHVRFEERELFRLLEERLRPDDLARLGEAIEAHG